MKNVSLLLFNVRKINAKVFLLVSVSLLMSGCSDSSIENLKASVMYDYPNYTVGQLFENRSVCSSVEWEVTEGSRGEKVIEYTCNMRNVVEFEERYIEDAISGMIKLKERKSPVEYQIEEEKKSAAYWEDDLEKSISRLEIDEGDSSVHRLEEQIAQLEEQYDLVSNVTLEDIIEKRTRGLRLPYEVSNARMKLTADPESIPLGFMESDEERHANATAVIESYLTETSSSLQSQVSQIKNRAEEIRREESERRERSVSLARERLDEIDQTIEALEAELVDRNISFENEIDKAISYFRGLKDKVSAREIFSWVETPDGSFEIIHAGFEGDSRIRGSVSVNYSNPKYALERVYRNDIENYEDFMRATGGLSEMDRIISQYNAVLLSHH